MSQSVVKLVFGNASTAKIAPAILGAAARRLIECFIANISCVLRFGLGESRMPIPQAAVEAEGFRGDTPLMPHLATKNWE